MSDVFESVSHRGFRGTKCIFEITIQNAQNSTWQGHIHWINENRKQHFRSVLEMLTLMDEALSEAGSGSEPVSWDS